MHADFFADQLRIVGGLDAGPSTDRVLDAFRAVPREIFAGDGPWLVRSGLAQNGFKAWRTPDADPRWLYHSVLIVLDKKKGINIGEPTLWARLLSRTDVHPGARVLQVGAGVGYYSAILAHLCGPDGHVTAYEIEGELAKRAAANLVDRSNVEVRCGNAVTDLVDGDAFDLVVAFAGVTHVPESWSSRLAPGGRLLLPLTGRDGWGAMALARWTGEGFDVVTLGRCGFYPCAGARSDAIEGHISDLLADPSHLNDWRFRVIGKGSAIRIEPGSN